MIFSGHRCDGASALSGRAGLGAWLGPGRRRLRAPNPASPRRRTRGEWVSGSGDPQQSSRAQGAGAAQPMFALWRAGAGGENGLCCFLNPRRVRAVVGCPRRVFLCRMQLPVARLGPSVQRGLGTVLPSWLMGHGWGLGAEGLRAPNPVSPRRRTRGEWVSDTGDHHRSSRAQGAWADQPRFALWRAGAGGEKGLRCFLDPRRVGAVVCCPRRVSLCRMQLPEARLGPSVRRSLGAERPS